MRKWFGFLALMLTSLLCSSGCMSTLFEKPAPSIVPAPGIALPTVIMTPVSEKATIPLSDIALNLTALPSDYILKDRSVMVSPEVTQITRDLGWKEGYFASFYRINKEKDDQTSIRQSVSTFPIENMNKVFSIEKEDMKSRANGSSSFYEIPFPPIGDTSIAYRATYIRDSYESVVYTVIFTYKNVYEKITMSGTTTDYEMLKDIAQKSAEKIR